MNVLGEIKKSLWNGRMAHAYILEAPAGETRDRLMTNILQEILCRNPNLEQRPCGLCEACRRVAAGSHEDVIYMKKSKLEDGKTKTVTPQDIGAVSRGSGHQSVITVVNEENHTEDAAIGFSLRVRRNENDASMKMDVSSYIGKTIKITAFVKTQDKKIRMGLDGAESKLLVEEKSLGDWTELSTVCEISEELNSAYLFFETDGNADFYLDDISITCQDTDIIEQEQKEMSLWEKIVKFFENLFHSDK